MRRRDLVELVVLAALWGGSFLFMRIAAPEFGPVALVFLRVAGATLLLLPILAARGELRALRRHWRPIAVVRLSNSALPFLGFAYAALSINAGLSAIFNSAAPLFAAVVAWLWLADRLTPARVVGLVVGFAGIVWLAWDKASTGGSASTWAILACLGASVCYGLSPSLTKRHLSGLPPLAVAAGSQLAATAFVAVPAAVAWPAALPSPAAWLAAGALAFFGTGIAYVLYFRLIAHAGPQNAVSVTFLIPLFAIGWGWLFLDETLTWSLAAGCAVVLLGTALATGVLKPRPGVGRSPSAATDA